MGDKILDKLGSIEDGILGGVALLTAFGTPETKIIDKNADSSAKKIGGSVEEVQDWRDVKKALSSSEKKQLIGSVSVDLPQGVVIRGGHHQLVNSVIEKEGGIAYSYTADSAEKRSNLIKAGLNTIYEVNKPVSPTYKTQNSGRDIIVRGKDEELRVMEQRKGAYCIFTSEFEKRFEKVEDQFDGLVLSGLEPLKGNIEAKTSRTKTQLEKLDMDTHVDFSHLNRKTSSKISKHILPSTDSLAVGPEEIKYFSKSLEIPEDSGEGEHLLRTVSRLFQAFNIEKLVYVDSKVTVLIEDREERMMPDLVVERMKELRNKSAEQLRKQTGRKAEAEELQNSKDGEKKIKELGKELNSKKLVEKGWDSSDGITVYAVPSIEEDQTSFYLNKLVFGSVLFASLLKMEN